MGHLTKVTLVNAAPSLDPIRPVINLTNFTERHIVPGAVPSSGSTFAANSGHSGPWTPNPVLSHC